jgi:DNA-binding CsgD family transcriptional regulator
MDTVAYGNWKGFTGKGLAERELETLLAVAIGMTDKQAAQAFGVSPRTVKGAIERCMHKLQVFKRAPLVAEAMRRGILAPLCVALVATLLVVQHQPSSIVRRPQTPRRVELRVAARRHEAAWAA